MPEVGSGPVAEGIGDVMLPAEPERGRGPEHVYVVKYDRPNVPTAGELRAGGYYVDPELSDDAVVTEWSGDVHEPPPAKEPEPSELKYVDEDVEEDRVPSAEELAELNSAIPNIEGGAHR